MKQREYTQAELLSKADSFIQSILASLQSIGNYVGAKGDVDGEMISILKNADSRLGSLAESFATNPTEIRKAFGVEGGGL